MAHEESVGRGVPGGEQLFYGPKPAKGLHLPLDRTVYRDVETAEAIAKYRSMFAPHPSPKVLRELARQARRNVGIREPQPQFFPIPVPPGTQPPPQLDQAVVEWLMKQANTQGPKVNRKLHEWFNPDINSGRRR